MQINESIPPQCHHMSFVNFVVLPPGHGRSVTDFEAGTPMRRSYVVPMVCEW